LGCPCSCCHATSKQPYVLHPTSLYSCRSTVQKHLLLTLCALERLVNLLVGDGPACHILEEVTDVLTSSGSSTTDSVHSPEGAEQVTSCLTLPLYELLLESASLFFGPLLALPTHPVSESV
jgi:hypothetical protein